MYFIAAFCIIWGENKMDLQIEKEQLKEYSTKVKSNAAAVLWLLGTTLAAFILYAVLLVITVAFSSPEQQTSVIQALWSDIAIFGGLLIPIFLPAIFLHWRKIRLGKTATAVFTVLCSISLLIDLLFVGLAFLLRLISGLFPHAGLFSGFVLETSGLLFWGIFIRTSLLISLLKNAENPKRTLRLILLAISVLEIALIVSCLCCIG